MNKQELEKILKSVPVPERPDEYWEQFPARVLIEARRRELREEKKGRATVPVTGWSRWFGEWFVAGGLKPALSLAVVLICIGLVFALGFWNGRHPTTEPQLAELRKCFAEIKTLFPNQLRGIVFDQQGARLLLADRPDVPASPPLYVKICGPKGCNYFITFSGQQIQFNGDSFDVLVDRQGDVLLVGNQLVWSSSNPRSKAGTYRVQARPLSSTS